MRRGFFGYDYRAAADRPGLGARRVQGGLDGHAAGRGHHVLVDADARLLAAHRQDRRRCGWASPPGTCRPPCGSTRTPTRSRSTAGRSASIATARCWSAGRTSYDAQPHRHANHDRAPVPAGLTRARHLAALVEAVRQLEGLTEQVGPFALPADTCDRRRSWSPPCAGRWRCRSPSTHRRPAADGTSRSSRWRRRSNGRSARPSWPAWSCRRGADRGPAPLRGRERRGTGCGRCAGRTVRCSRPSMPVRPTRRACCSRPPAR